MSNRLATLTVLCLALIGVCFLVSEYLGGPDPFTPDKTRELLRLFSYLAVVVVLLEIIPNAVRKLRGDKLKEILPPLCFLIGVYTLIFCMDPEAVENPGFMYGLVVLMVAVLILFKIIRVYLARHYAVKVEGDKNDTNN